MAGTGGSVGRERELSRPQGLLGGDARSLAQRLFGWQAKISFSGRPDSPRSRTANRGLAAAQSILFVLAAAVVLSVVVIGAAPAALAAGPSVSLALTPESATITAGLSQKYQATIHQTNDQGADVYSQDVTGSTKFTLVDGTCTTGACTPATDGSCTTTTDTATTCTATATGRHTVIGTVSYQGYTTGTVTATAFLDVQPGPPVSLTLNPGSGSITAGDNSQPYQATGTDAHGNSFDATGSTDFTIAPDGSCTPTDPKTCTATIAGPHTVTGTIDLGNGVTIRGTATLKVKAGHPASLTLTPESATITAGRSQPYQATGTDAYGNSLGDLTSSTGFTIAPDGSCAPTEPKTCTATIAGRHTVTGTIDLGNRVTIRGTATLTVKPGPPATLSLHPRQVTTTVGKSQAYQDDGRDAYGNSLGDLTSSTAFTITDGTCSTNSCTATTVGPHTVTGTIHLREHVVTGAATLQVQPGIAPPGQGSSPPRPSPSPPSDSSPPSPAPSSSSNTGPPAPVPSSGSSLPPPAVSPFRNTRPPPPSASGPPSTSPNCRPAARQLHGLRVAPRAALPGTSVRIAARLDRNFAGCPLAVLLGGSHVGDTTVRRDGSVSDQSAVPEAAKSGVTTLAITRTDGGVLATTAFEVVPKPPPTPQLLHPLLGLLVTGGALLLSVLGAKAVSSQRARRQRRWVHKHVRFAPDSSPGRISAALDPDAPPPLTVRLDPQDHAGTIGITKETDR